MPVVGTAKLHKISVEGEIGTDGFAFVAIYQVTVDDLEDGPSVVLGASGLPLINDQWSYGNDGTVTAFLKKMRARRSNVPLIWHVVCTYNSPTVNGDSQDDLRDEDGQPVSDPADVPIRIVPSFITSLEPVERAQFIDYVDYEGTSLTTAGQPLDVTNVGSLDSRRGDYIVPQNSAYVAFVPPLEKEVSRPLFKCTVWRSAWASKYDTNLDSVNNASFQLVGVDSQGNYFDRTFAARTLLYRNVLAELVVQSNYKVLFRLTFELLFKSGGWYRDILDRGLTRLGYYTPSIADGFGGTLGSDWNDGNASNLRITEPSGDLITEPAPLDGHGQPLENPSPANQIYLRYLPHDEFDISTLFT